MAARVLLGAGLAALATADWEIITPDPIGELPLGVAFWEDGLTGIGALSDPSDDHYIVVQSLDGGKTWATTDDQGLFGLYNVAAGAELGIVSGIVDVLQTTDKGASFSSANNSLSFAGGEVVRKRYSSATNSSYSSVSGFAIIGTTTVSQTDGVVLSSDATADTNWTVVEVKAFETGQDIPPFPIDGAFPSDAAWYLAGQLDLSGVAKAPQRSRARARLYPVAAGGTRGSAAPSTVSAGTYLTLIAKSTDNGATWSIVHQDNTVAAQSMDCLDDDHCCFASEDARYAYIHCSVDGGSTWTKVLSFTSDGAALPSIRVDGAGYWAVGGTASAEGVLAPAFFRSVDGGVSFQQVSVSLSPAGVIATNVDCTLDAPGAPCWATMMDEQENAYVATTSNS